MGGAEFFKTKFQVFQRPFDMIDPDFPSLEPLFGGPLWSPSLKRLNYAFLLRDLLFAVLFVQPQPSLSLLLFFKIRKAKTMFSS